MGCYVEAIARWCIGVLAFLFWVSAANLWFAGYLLISLYTRNKIFFHDYNILLPSGFAVGGSTLLAINGLLGIKISSRGTRCQQGTFMYFIVVLLCILSSGVVLAYVCTHWLDYELRPMQIAFQQYNGSGISVDTIQTQLHCCGLKNYTDWETTWWYKNSGNYTVPKSCCNVAYSVCFGNIANSNELYLEVLAIIFDGIMMTHNPFQDFRILESGTFA
ncbi:tetraspanin-3-like [Leptodactylus fuscus]